MHSRAHAWRASCSAITVIAAMVVVVHGQSTPPSSTAQAAKSTYTPPRTPWGDPEATWTKPWTMLIQLQKGTAAHVYEYACHEGNYAMKNILSGARADERR